MKKNLLMIKYNILLKFINMLINIIIKMIIINLNNKYMILYLLNIKKKIDK